MATIGLEVAGQANMERLLTAREVAHRLSVSVDTVRRWARIGFGPTPVKVGPSAVRYRPEDVEAWIKSGGAA